MAEIHTFRLLPMDTVAVNPCIRFGVEDFVPAPEFTPSKDFRARLSWHDLDGNSQSKLLLTPPEEALAIAVRGEAADASIEAEAPKRPPRRRRTNVRAAPKR